MPLQNMSQVSGCVMMEPESGSQTPACKFVLPATLPEPETTRTFPVRSSAVCTGLMGIRSGRVFHSPTTDLKDCARIPTPGIALRPATSRIATATDARLGPVRTREPLRILPPAPGLRRTHNVLGTTVVRGNCANGEPEAKLDLLVN